MNKSENNKKDNTELNSSIGNENKEAKKAHLKHKHKCKHIATLLDTLRQQQTNT